VGKTIPFTFKVLGFRTGKGAKVLGHLMWIRWQIDKSIHNAGTKIEFQRRDGVTLSFQSFGNLFDVPPLKEHCTGIVIGHVVV
jgi:hypothetical protein